jgi:uncharacterized protein (TIGR02996 family)
VISSATLDSFFEAILASPEDDGPRLAYADWLRQRGDPRGELFAAQCALVALDEDADERRELQERQWALIDEHGPAWLAEVGLGPGEGAFHRGLIEEVSAPFHHLEPAHERLGTRAFVRKLRTWEHLRYANTHDPPTNVMSLERLLSWEWMARVRTLDLSDNGHFVRVDPAGLAECPRLAGLTALDLTGANVWRESMQALANSPFLTNLRWLELKDNAVFDAGVRALARSSCLTRLEHLGLARNHVRGAGSVDDCVEDLVASTALASLRSLDLGGNGLREADRARIRHRFGKRVRF